MFKNNNQVWMVEERLQGHFKKLINNNMAFIRVPQDSLEDQEKASAIVHFSYNYSYGEILLTDLQGIQNVSCVNEGYFDKMGLKCEVGVVDPHKYSLVKIL